MLENKSDEDIDADVLNEPEIKLDENEIKKGKNIKKLLKIQSTQAFLPVRDIKDGIIITKDRRYVKIIEIAPINFLLRSQEEQSGIIQSFASVIKVLPVRTQFKVIARTSNVSHYIDKIRENMEREENENCKQLQQEQIDLISTVGSREGVSRRFFIIFQYEEETRLKKSASFSEIRASLETSVVRIQNLLTRCENEVNTFNNDDELLKTLYYILCKSESEKLSFELKSYETVSRYLTDADYNPDVDSYIPVSDFIAPKSIDMRESAKYAIIDGVYYAFAYIPSKSYSTRCVGGWLSLLVNLGEGIDVDLFLKKENISEVQTKLTYALRFNKVKVRNMEDSSSDYEEVRDAINAGYYLKQGISNGENFCYMGVMLTISAASEKELEWKVNEVKMFLLSQDLKLKLCWFQQEDALLMTMPLCYINDNLFKKMRRNVLTSGAASAYPFCSYEVNDENGIMFGTNKANNSLVFIDAFDSKKYKNANMAILGTSGAGKTYTLQCMAMRMRENGIQVFIIAPNKGHEFKRACDGVGGEYIKIAPGSNQNINIMEIRKKNTEVTELLDGEDSVKSSMLATKIQRLHTFFTLLIPDISHEEKQLLDEALVNTYRKFGITNDNNSLISASNPERYTKMPVLSDLHDELKKGGQQTRHLYNILSRYVSGSANSFNSPTNVDLDNKYIVLDVSALTKEMIAVGMFIVLDYVLDKCKEDRTVQKAILLDELWNLIGANASDEAAGFVLEIFKTLRAYNVSAVGSTQDLNDFFSRDDGKYGKGIINNSKIKWIMQLEQEEAVNVRDSLDLSETEMQQIMHFKRGEGLLLANQNHIPIKFRASNTEDELVTTDPKQLKIISERKRMMNKTCTTRFINA